MSKTTDSVSHPAHYNTSQFEVWDVLDAWFATDPLLWQVGKYLARAGHKGDSLTDLEKAQNYLTRRIEKEKQIRSEATLDNSRKEI